MNKEEIIKLTNMYLSKSVSKLRKDFWWVRVTDYKAERVSKISQSKERPNIINATVWIRSLDNSDAKSAEIEIDVEKNEVTQLYQ